jgi:hypothetical protein
MVLEIWRARVSSNIGLIYRGMVVKSQSPHLFAIGYHEGA